MQAILGVDAAWTPTQPSGVALIRGQGRRWEVMGVAPSYRSFIELAAGRPIDWLARGFSGEAPPVASILETARALAGCDLAVVALDMPVATCAFTTRRAADNAVSSRFGGRGCSAHSPTAARPGELGARLMQDLVDHGFPLATSAVERPAAPCTIEVYPHPALLTLMGESYRVPYKVSRSSQYWRGQAIAERIGHLLAEFGGIEKALEDQFGDLRFAIPGPGEVPTLAGLKRYEDALDALVCAWVGVRFLQGSAEPFGDHTAAVWVPT